MRTEGHGEGQPLNRAKIMVMDDDADLRQALSLRLRANNFETVNVLRRVFRHRDGPEGASASDHSRPRITRGRRIRGPEKPAAVSSARGHSRDRVDGSRS